MPLPLAPLAPVAGIALRYGAVALATYAVARKTQAGRRDQRAEDALDELDEGLTLRRDGEDTSTTARFRRVIRLGQGGPGIEIDACGFARVRIRRV